MDRREDPSHGYRAVHVIAEISGKPVEIQVRTSLQHLWAELSEKLSDHRDPAIKYGGGPHPWQLFLARVSDLFARKEEIDRLAGSMEDARTLDCLRPTLTEVDVIHNEAVALIVRLVSKLDATVNMLDWSAIDAKLLAALTPSSRQDGDEVGF